MKKNKSLRPLGDRVLVHLQSTNLRSDIIAIPAVHKNTDPAFVGRVIAVGNDVKESLIVPGVRVLVNQYQGQDVKSARLDHKIFVEKDIIALV